MGQSAIASDPSRIASVSRCGDATDPASRWSRPITIGPRSSPAATIALKRSPARWRRPPRPRRAHRVERPPGGVALAVAEPADPRRQPLERDALLGELDPAPDVLL